MNRNLLESIKQLKNPLKKYQKSSRNLLTDKNVAKTNGTNFPAVNSNCLVDLAII